MQYKCNDCKTKFSSDEDFPQCPNPDCGSINVVPINKTSIWKWIVVPGAVFLFIILIIMMRGCPQDTKITYKQLPQTNGSIMVEIEGKYCWEFEIDLIREDGVSMGKSLARVGMVANKQAKPRKRTYDNLSSTEKDLSYTLKITYKGKNAKQRQFNVTKQFNFSKIEETQMPCSPSITKIILNPNILSNPNQKYIVKVEIDTSCKDKVEYSMDSLNWQNSNVFQNIAGNDENPYTFYVRNSQDNTLLDSTKYLLPEYKPIPLPTTAELTALLTKIAQQNQKAHDDFTNLVGKVKVKGVPNISDGTDLANHAYIKKQSFQVIQIEEQSGVIVSITVR